MKRSITMYGWEQRALIDLLTRVEKGHPVGHLISTAKHMRQKLNEAERVPEVEQDSLWTDPYDPR